MTSWYISKNTRAYGPFSEADVIYGIQTREYNRGALVWSKGMATWEPIESRFSHAFAGISQTAPNRSVIDYRFIPTINLRKIFYAVINLPFFKPLVTSSVLFLIFSYIQGQDGKFQSIFDWGLPWVLSLFGSITAGFITLRKAWLWAEEKGSASQNNAWGLVKVICIISGASLLLLGLTYCAVAKIYFRVDQARQAYDKFTINVDVSRHAVVVEGLIGPTFAEKLDEILEVHANLKTVEIQSPGGLVDQALKAAKSIEKYKGLTVAAHKICNSACLIILMAGEHRLADWDMTLGFHPTSAITQVEGAEEGLSQIGIDADEYLKKRGVPAEIMKHGFSGTDKSMDYVPAIDLVDAKVLTGLINGVDLISSEEAKWRYVEKLLVDNKKPAIGGLRGVLVAIRETSPGIVMTHANEIYQAVNLGDEAKVANALKFIPNEIMLKAMMAADGDLLYQYYRDNYNQIDYLSKMEQWRVCVNYAEGNIGHDIDVASTNDMKSEFNSLINLIRSAAGKNWLSQPVPTWAESQGNALISTVVQDVAKQGLAADKLDSDVRTKCIFYHILFKRILDEGAEKAPPILRWLIQQDEKAKQ